MDKSIDYGKYGLEPGIIHVGKKRFDLRTDSVSNIAAQINAELRMVRGEAAAHAVRIEVRIGGKK